MKRILITLLLLCAPAWAQDGNVLIEYALVRTTNPPAKKLVDTAAWSKDLAAGKHQVLNQGSVSTTFGKNAYAMMGRKVPFHYYDPRVEAPQVQYIDEGFKLDCKPKKAANGLVLLEVRIDQQKLEGSGGNLEESDQFVCESTVLMKRGQTAIVGSTKGALTARQLAILFPGTTFSEDTSVLLTVTLK